MDLDLPSGTLWATMNVGASEATDAGLYFQWGDTSGYTDSKVGTGSSKKEFSWADYKWNPSGDGSTFTKYTTPGVTLELEDDAANVKMGGDWHMPSPEQINELLDNTTSFWVKTGDGLGGRHFRSIKDSSKSIFIPAAGYAYDGSVVGVGDEADVWSSVLDTGNASYGQALDFDSDRIYLNYDDDRCYGFPVRGVLG